MKTGAIVLALLLAVLAAGGIASELLSRIRARVCARPREARRCRACRGHRALRHRLVRWEIAAITPAGSRKKHRALPRPEPGPRIRRVRRPRGAGESNGPIFEKTLPQISSSG